MRAYYPARALVPISRNGPTAAALRQFLADVDPESLNVVEVAACLAVAARLELDSAAERLLPRLLADQAAGGGWSKARWFTDPAGNDWRSAAFSTALALEALVLAQNRLSVVR